METFPEKPSEKDCCGSGCSPCVFEVYEKLLENFSEDSSGSFAVNCSVPIRHDLLSPLKYKPFSLVSVEKVNRNTNLYCFKPLMSKDDFSREENSKVDFISNTRGVLPYYPGQHIIMINAKETMENTSSISRAYTPISVAKMQTDCIIKLLIKLYENGSMSSFINQLVVNDVAFFRGPFGNFHHFLNARYLMICAGTGFAPMIPIIESILSNEDDETVMRLCLACSTLNDVYFREKIRQFSRYWNFEAHIYLSNESADEISKNVAHNENMFSRRITLDVLKEKRFSVKHRVLICGSELFNKDIQSFAELCGCDDIFIF